MLIFSNVSLIIIIYVLVWPRLPCRGDLQCTFRTQVQWLSIWGNIHAQQHSYGKFSPTTQQYWSIKIINKNFRFSKHYMSETCGRHLIELIFKPVLMYLNVFSYWRWVWSHIQGQTPKPSTAGTPLHSSNMLGQGLYHFCNRSSPDDGPKSGRKC